MELVNQPSEPQVYLPRFGRTFFTFPVLVLATLVMTVMTIIWIPLGEWYIGLSLIGIVMVPLLGFFAGQAYAHTLRYIEIHPDRLVLQWMWKRRRVEVPWSELQVFEPYEALTIGETYFLRSISVKRAVFWTNIAGFPEVAAEAQRRMPDGTPPTTTQTPTEPEAAR
jgi:uncharacterized membrane protein YdbT with pleckstrin-like domain